MYISPYFKIAELVSPQLLEVMGETMAWRLIPPSVLQDLDCLRSKHGYPIRINGSGNTQCGVRAINCSIGAKMSRHKLVDPRIVAFDLHSPHLKALTDLVLECHSDYGICRIENPQVTNSWLHCEFYDGISVPRFDVFNP
jgi:hypothetical protein